MALPSAGARFHQALASSKPLQIVGTVNAYTAIQAERLGHKAIYLSGGGVALASLGLPDLGVSTLNDVVTDVRRITRNCSTPLLVDVDTGFGNGLSITRTIQDVQAAGAAACHIEDQITAKRCGHRPNKQVVSTGEMVSRLKCAVAGRTDPNFVIIARTDALAVEGMDSVLKRCEAYVKAGADALFPEALTKLEQYRKIKEALPGVPILANMTEFGKTPLFHKDELADAGASMARPWDPSAPTAPRRRSAVPSHPPRKSGAADRPPAAPAPARQVLYPLSAFRAQSSAAERVLRSILETGGNAKAVDLMHTREQTYSVIDYHKYERAMDAALSAGEEEK